MCEKCFFCANDVKINNGETTIYICNYCGRYIISDEYIDVFFANNKKDRQKLKIKSYLYYHNKENVCKFIGTKEAYNNYKNSNPNSTAELVTLEMIDNWYPKNFFEKVDYILQFVFSKITEEDNKLFFNYPELESFLFCNMNGDESVDNYYSKIEQTFNYLKQYLVDNHYVNIFESNSHKYQAVIQLSPKGLERVYELNKNQIYNKNVFIAMKFGDETKGIREVIKRVLVEIGYNPIIMDELEHNNQIVPEMLYNIRNSKFVIAELSHHNNGAYYEAGYALGCGKDVIQICKEDALKSAMHFDVQQVNTITYNDIAEIPQKLKNRIEATIK